MTQTQLARHPWLLILALIVAELVAIFEGSMIYAAIGEFYKIFENPISVGWTLTAFLLVSASTAVVFGRLADMSGRKRVALILLVFSIVGSIISAVAQDVTLVIVGRALQGLTSAVLPISYGLMRQHLSREQAMAGIGIVSAVMTVGGGVGVFTGGLILDLLSWRWIFIFSAIVATLAFVMVYFFVPSHRQPATDKKVDYIGALLFMIPISTLLYAISNLGDWGLTDGRALGLITLGVALFAFWVFYELRQREPLVDIRMLAKRQPLLANLSMMMLALGPLQAKAFVMLLLQQPSGDGAGLGLSASVAGLIMFLPMSMGVIGGPSAAFVANRYSARLALIIGTLLIAIGWVAVATYHTNLWFILALMMAVGMGLAMASAAVPMLILEAVPPERTSEATATITSLRPAAMAIGVQLSSFFIALHTVQNAGGGSYVSDQGFMITFSFVALASLLALVAALLLPRSTSSRQSQ